MGLITCSHTHTPQILKFRATQLTLDGCRGGTNSSPSGCKPFSSFLFPPRAKQPQTDVGRLAGQLLGGQALSDVELEAASAVRPGLRRWMGVFWGLQVGGGTSVPHRLPGDLAPRSLPQRRPQLPRRRALSPVKPCNKRPPPVDAPRNLALRHCNCNTATTDDVSVDCTFWSWRHASVATASPAPLSHTPRLRPRLRAGHGRPIFFYLRLFYLDSSSLPSSHLSRLLRHSVHSSSCTVSSLLHHPAVHHGLCHPSQQRCPAGFPPHLR